MRIQAVLSGKNGSQHPDRVPGVRRIDLSSAQLASSENARDINRDIVLEWIGSSQRNGQDCALIRFQALLNPVEIMNAGITLKGLSNYWGQIWVSTATRQIEYATINETVVGDLKLAGQDTPMTINVIRSGVLEPVTVK